MNLSLQFDKGTILVYGAEKHQLQFLNGLSWDERTNSFRAPAAEYRKLYPIFGNIKLLIMTMPANFLH